MWIEQSIPQACCQGRRYKDMKGKRGRNLPATAHYTQTWSETENEQ